MMLKYLRRALGLKKPARNAYAAPHFIPDAQNDNKDQHPELTDPNAEYAVLKICR